MYLNLRMHLRLSVGADFSVSYHLDGRPFRGLRLTNLGAGGCALRLSFEAAKVLEKGSLLQDFSIHHPSLPQMPQLAQVAWILGQQAASQRGGPDRGYVLVGIKFAHPAPGFQIRVTEFVAEGLRIPLVA